MKMTRQPVIWLILLFFISCKENEKSSTTVPPVSTGTSSETDDPGTVENLNDEALFNNYAGVDISPMDMSYFPVDYPKLKMTNEKMAPPVMRVIYSRPHLQGRELFHDVLRYGDRWRLGANEATEIAFYRNVTIQGVKVNAGRYVLYSVLGPDKWTVVLNSNTDSWGLKQDTTKNVRSFDIPVTHGNPSLEYFTMVFEKTSTGANLLMAWDDVLAKLPVDF